MEQGGVERMKNLKKDKIKTKAALGMAGGGSGSSSPDSKCLGERRG
jgi:hypothetical protein